MRFCGFAALVLCLVAAAGAEVYKWTDADGRVHYGERPPPGGAQRLELAPGPAGTAGTAGAVGDAERRARQQRLLESYDYERQRRKAEDAREAERAREQAAACDDIRRRWRRLSFPGPVYFSDGDGERRYLSDAERAQRLDRLRPAYRAACGEEP